jgi:thiamine biosynthesis lipoprotein
VTVVAPEAETADVLATAVFVLGPDHGLRLASTLPNVQAFVIGGNGRYYMTDDFRSVAEFRDN